MSMYELHLQVPTKLLTTILELIEGEGILVKMAVLPADEKRKPRKPRHYANGARLKGIDGRQLILKTLSSGPKSLTDVMSAFVTHGFAPSSASSRLSQLRAKGEITRLADQKYALAKA